MRTNYSVPRFYAGRPMHSVFTFPHKITSFTIFSVSGIENFMPCHLREAGWCDN